ncbi:hypothetical protein ACTG2C_17960 [Aeromonas veronii]
MSELNNDLFVTIGELVDEPVAQTGPSGDFIYVDISSIDRETKKITETKKLAHAQAPSRAKQVLKAGDVLVSMTRPNLNAVALVPQDLAGAIGSTGFHVIRSSWLHPKYILALVQTHSFIDAMSSVVQGALYPAVRPRDVAAYRFKYDTPAQQIRIVEKLEELLTDLDSGVAELKMAQRKLAQYRQSLLKAAVEGALTAQWRENNPATESGAQLLERILQERRTRWEAKQLAKFAEQGKTPPKEWQKKYPEPVQPDTTDLPQLPEGWVWASLEQISEIQGGIQKQPSRVPKENKYPFLRVANVARGKLKLDDVHDIELFTGELERLALVAGDILIVEGNGSLAEIGRCAVWDGSIENAVHQNHLIRVRPIIVNSQFVETWVNSLGGIDKLTKLAVTTSGLYTLSVKKISKIPVPIAPLTEQESATQTLIESLSALYLQEQSIELSLKQCAAQRQNILRAAFSGQLVPQDPNDEPASVLLERIRAQRVEQAKQPKPRKTKKKESSTVARKLVDVLTEAGDWLPAQEAFRRCGIADGVQTEEIEALYAELRALDKSQHLSVKAVFDLVDTPEGKKHRKVADHLKWVG